MFTRLLVGTYTDLCNSCSSTQAITLRIDASIPQSHTCSGVPMKAILLRSAMQTTWNAAQKVLKNQVMDLLCHLWVWELHPHAAVFTKWEERAYQTKDLDLENYLVTKFLLLLHYMKKTGIHSECPGCSTDHGSRQAYPEEQVAQKLCSNYK